MFNLKKQPSNLVSEKGEKEKTPAREGEKKEKEEEEGEEASSDSEAESYDKVHEELLENEKAEREKLCQGILSGVCSGASSVAQAQQSIHRVNSTTTSTTTEEGEEYQASLEVETPELVEFINKLLLSARYCNVVRLPKV